MPFPINSEEKLELEEILLGYLRDSSKVKLAKLDVKKDNDQDNYQIMITFDVEEDFPGSLTSALKPFPTFV